MLHHIPDTAPARLPMIAGGLLIWLSGMPTTRANDFAAFQQDESPAIAKALATTPKHYRQIEPSLYYLTQQYKASLSELSADDRRERLVALAQFIDKKRSTVATDQVIGPGRALIGLLDPDHGLDPKEITALATTYKCSATIFKKTTPSQSLQDVGNAFLSAVADAARPEATPTTVIVLGHGLPTEIQSYHIPVDRLVDTLVTAAAPTDTTLTSIDLSHLTIICDDCYSADFMINLGHGITNRCRERSLKLTCFPTLIAGTNRDCVGHADVGRKFVPHFWKDVIELFYIRRPHPQAITIGDFLEKVDNMMYGYGRRPIIQGSHVVGYRLLDPTMVQDPVIFVSLNDDERTELAKLLGLKDTASCELFLDIG